jgi:hypothetical protein
LFSHTQTANGRIISQLSEPRIYTVRLFAHASSARVLLNLSKLLRQAACRVQNQPPTAAPLDAQIITDAIATAFQNLPAAAAPAPVNTQVIADAIAAAFQQVAAPAPANTQVIADAIAAAFQQLPAAAAAVVAGPVPFARTPAGARTTLLNYESQWQTQRSSSGPPNHCKRHSS